MRQMENAEPKKKIDVKKLIQDLKSEDIKVHASAHLSLLVAGDQAIPALKQALGSQDQNLRWEAAKTLAEMRNPALAPVLVQNLENKDPDIRWLSAEGLIALGSEAIIPLLIALTNYTGSLWLKSGAHHILYDLYWGKLHDGENEYHTKHPLDKEKRAFILPILKELEKPESSLISPDARIALNDLGYQENAKQANRQ